MAAKPVVHELINLYESFETNEKIMNEHTRYSGQLLPSPWAEMTPSLSIPFSSKGTLSSEADSERPSLLTFTTSSPVSSPTSSPISASPRMHRFTSSLRQIGKESKKRCSASSLGLNTILLRRRPSAVDLALTEERFRCNEDSVERRGLDLLEPRPVDPIPITDTRNNLMNNLSSLNFDTRDSSSLTPSTPISERRPPRFVMGGIIEVMEGST